MRKSIKSRAGTAIGGALLVLAFTTPASAAGVNHTPAASRRTQLQGRVDALKLRLRFIEDDAARYRASHRGQDTATVRGARAKYTQTIAALKRQIRDVSGALNRVNRRSPAPVGR